MLFVFLTCEISRKITSKFTLIITSQMLNLGENTQTWCRFSVLSPIEQCFSQDEDALHVDDALWCFIPNTQDVSVCYGHDVLMISLCAHLRVWKASTHRQSWTNWECEALTRASWSLKTAKCLVSYVPNEGRIFPLEIGHCSWSGRFAAY